MLRTRTLLAAGVAGAVVLGMASSAAAANRVAYSSLCGTSITASLTLTSNLSCPATALLLGPIKGPITIDLGGHTVNSVNGPTMDMVGSTFAVTVQNGRIVGNVNELSGRRNVYQHLTFDGGGLFANSDGRPTVKNNRFVNGAVVRTDQNTIDIESNEFIKGPVTEPAIWLSFTYATVIHNTISGYETGIVVDQWGSSVDAERNVISHAGTGIRVGGVGNDQVPGVVAGNRVSSSAGDGIILGVGSGLAQSPQTPGLTASSNVVRHNGGDGIHVNPVPSDPSGTSLGIAVTLTGNTAVGNRNYGIESPGALPKVTVADGGGNSAHANGTGQCLNIAC